MEMPVEVTLWTAVSNFVHVRCKCFGWFRRLVRTKIQPSPIIIYNSIVITVTSELFSH